MFLAVVIGCVVLASGIGFRYLFVTTPDDAATAHAPRISDPAFEAAATTVCRRYATIFDTATTLSKTPSPQDSAGLLDSIASSFDTMVGELRALSVAPADRAAVDNWLAQWDAYDAYGHRYATAVRAGTDGQLVAADSARIGQLRRTRNGFARANHMSGCAFG